MDISKLLKDSEITQFFIDAFQAIVIECDHEAQKVYLNTYAKDFLKISEGMFLLSDFVTILTNQSIDTLATIIKNKRLATFEESLFDSDVRVAWHVKIQKNERQLIIGRAFCESASVAKYAELADYYENIISLMPGHVYWQGLNGTYLGCNNEQAQSAGLSHRKEIVNKTNKDLPWNLLSTVVVDRLEKINEKILSDNGPQTIEEPGMFKDGTEAVFLSKKIPLKNKNGKITGILGISFDITERKRAEIQLKEAKEQAEIANQVKSDFIACMSHDLRTPLNGISGAVQVLQRNPHYPEQEKFLENLSKSANTLLYLVEDILNFAKLESGKIQLCSAPFDMRKLIEDVVSLVAHQAQQKGLKLVVSYCDSVPCHVISDPNAIRRILVNLLGNAIKFTESGHIFVSVDVVEARSGEAVIQLAVEDTGIGIPKEKINLVFDKFSRLNPSYNGRYQGTGLGLTIVKQLTEMLEGTINVHSQINCGSTFWCTLPIKLQDKANANSKWHQYYQNIRVLIVDDYEVRGKNIKNQLAFNDNMVCHSNEAISQLESAYQQNNPFQVIVVDDEIVNLSAIDLATKIRAHKEFNQFMLILFSSPRTLSANEVAKKSGYYRQFVKPVQPVELLNDLAAAWEAWKNQIHKQLNSANHRKCNVLLVEDDEIAQMVSKTMLENLGCKVEVVSTSTGVCQAIEKKEYDLIFMDIGLPGENGISVTKKILRKYGEKFLTPIVGLTAHAFEHNRIECINAGMTSFISKPVSYEDFEKILSSNLLKYDKNYVEDVSYSD